MQVSKDVMRTRLLDPLNHRWLAGPLSVWGKLPSHGDYLRHRTTAGQGRDWQNWVTRVWNLRTPARQRVRAANSSDAGWLQLEPRKVKAELAAVPVAFVMQPGSMPFSPRHCVQGVFVASEDQFGRACPLIIFQQVAPGWMRRTWGGARALADANEQNLLYWLSRLAARTHGADRDWLDLTQAVDAIWQLHAPTWRNLLGMPVTNPEQAGLQAALTQYCDSEHADAALGLQGVRKLPWANWPNRILRSQNPAQAFWQQDMRGGYVNASDSLQSLWGARL